MDRNEDDLGLDIIHDDCDADDDDDDDGVIIMPLLPIMRCLGATQ